MIAFSNDAMHSRAMEWIARLPLLGEHELALLLGAHDVDAAALRHHLDRDGWIESIRLGSPEIDLRPLAFVRDGALPALAEALGTTPRDLKTHAPFRRADILDRVARVEIAAGANRFLAELARALRDEPSFALTDARSLPMATPSGGRWWLPSIEAYGCVQVGELSAPFFVAWDRAGAPNEHRSERVAAWLRATPAVGSAWGAAGLPPILIVCPSARELEAWRTILLRAAERDDRARLDVLLTTIAEIADAGILAAIWREPERDRTALLIERLGWGEKPPIRELHIGDMDTSAPPQPRASQRLREWALCAATEKTGTASERLAAIAMTTSGEQKALLEMLAHHPWLSASELAALFGVSDSLVERQLPWLVRCGLLRIHLSTGKNSVSRYALSDLGINLCAKRAGVPLRRYAHCTSVTDLTRKGESPDPGGATTLREHALGVNRTFARLAADARSASSRLDCWLNEAESTRHFRHDGRWWWIRPDGSGVLSRGGVSRPFLLEYDRGTLDAGDFRGKFSGYKRYFAEEAWNEDFSVCPQLLFVCEDDRSEERVARAALTHAPCVPLLLTSTWRYESDRRNDAGLLGPIWRSLSIRAVRREAWPLLIRRVARTSRFRKEGERNE